jgi:hypothetical protein
MKSIIRKGDYYIINLTKKDRMALRYFLMEVDFEENTVFALNNYVKYCNSKLRNLKGK